MPVSYGGERKAEPSAKAADGALAGGAPDTAPVLWWMSRLPRSPGGGSLLPENMDTEGTLLPECSEALGGDAGDCWAPREEEGRTVVTIFGMTYCGYSRNAARQGYLTVNGESQGKEIKVRVFWGENAETPMDAPVGEAAAALKGKLAAFCAEAGCAYSPAAHSTWPIVFRDRDFVGGSSEFIEWLEREWHA